MEDDKFKNIATKGYMNIKANIDINNIDNNKDKFSEYKLNENKINNDEVYIYKGREFTKDTIKTLNAMTKVANIIIFIIRWIFPLWTWYLLEFTVYFIPVILIWWLGWFIIMKIIDFVFDWLNK
ncbi:MAG: hypothetical protein LBR40_01560 [Bacilli bacterium]|jgi:hypothetical protein|nr:hypothetical protein [Bacilli bacterium]